jgi:hypothetical protein
LNAFLFKYSIHFLKSGPLAPIKSLAALHLLISLTVSFSALAQPITGTWRGKIGSTKIELKLIKEGDSLVGTVYYYTSGANFRSYAVRGYFEDATNSVVWWDDRILEEQRSGAGLQTAGQGPVLAVADFNCPGEGIMKLEGSSTPRDSKEGKKNPVELQKVTSPLFDDPWNYVLRNYTHGASDPRIIDSIATLAYAGPVPAPQDNDRATGQSLAPHQVQDIMPAQAEPKPAAIRVPPLPPEPAVALTPTQKFAGRSKTLQTVIPIAGDSVELRFYDDAEIDGDSIAVFLNGNLLKQDIGLTDQPYKIMIPVSRLDNDNELVMVAENLGSIPPNTSLMVVLMGDKRYEARLFADEHTSALVRFVRETSPK